jgi:hypothetical protein
MLRNKQARNCFQKEPKQIDNNWVIALPYET